MSQVHEHLTERERDVLALLVERLSDREIAERLFLEVNTVKWYNRQIYEKLGVKNRREAIARAGELGLLEAQGAATDDSIEQPQLEQRVYFTTSSDSTRIAYATVGDGPPLVRAAHWLTHLEFDWESAVWLPWLFEWTKDRTYIRYDERGSGLSDWDAEDMSLDAWVDDLEAVVDALGLEQFPLIGASQGGPVALAYAVRHPERVSHLILYGAYARPWLEWESRPDRLEEGRALITLMRAGWGRDNPAFRRIFATQFMPEASIEQLNALDELMRISTSAETAIRLQKAISKIDIRDLAPKVAVPTLVLHCRADAVIGFEEGRLLASLIPHAQFVALESKNHILIENEPAWHKLFSAIRQFLAE